MTKIKAGVTVEGGRQRAAEDRKVCSGLESDAAGFRSRRLHKLTDGIEEGLDMSIPSWLATICPSSASFPANSLCVVTTWRSLTKARMTNTLIWTACGLLSTLAAMIAPCSVKALGRNLMFCPRFKITDCDLERERKWCQELFSTSALGLIQSEIHQTFT